MGNARKQLFFGIERFPSKTCPICNSLDPDTWLHVLLKCTNHHIHALQIKRHNKAVWALCELILSNHKTHNYILMNAGTFNNNPPENTIPHWLLPCICSRPRCQCNARFKPDILYIAELPFLTHSTSTPTTNCSIQFIEFTYTNDRFSQDTIDNKILKYQPLINNITNLGWIVKPLIVITAGARGTIHSPSMKILENALQLPIKSIKQTFQKFNTIAIHHASSILLYK